MSLGLFVPIISQFKQYFLPAALIVQEVKYSNVFIFEFFFVILGCLNHNGVWVNVVLLEHDDAYVSYVLSLFIKDHSVHPFCLLVCLLVALTVEFFGKLHAFNTLFVQSLLPFFVCLLDLLDLNLSLLFLHYKELINQATYAVRFCQD